MIIIICLGLGYLAAVAGFWFVIAAEYREWISEMKPKK
jgi:hypothetical protein